MTHATTHTFIFTFFCKKSLTLLSMSQCEINSLVSLKLLHLFMKSATYILLLTLVCIKNYVLHQQIHSYSHYHTITKLEMHNLVQWAVRVL